MIALESFLTHWLTSSESDMTLIGPMQFVTSSESDMILDGSCAIHKALSLFVDETWVTNYTVVRHRNKRTNTDQ